ncbi:MAG: hypothetical protein RBS51_07915 [Anaerovoracaceae bacterium]|nr:hypothetical protein [Anaerovoracaceae bacterium]
MTKAYIDGELDSVSYSLDFPYEVETRYKMLLKEDRALAQIIYDCLVEEGVNLYQDITEEEFKDKIKNEYEFIMDIVEGNVDIF